MARAIIQWMSVSISTIPSKSHHIGVITLNRPNQLNVLNLEMVTTIVNQLKLWELDDTIACVVFQSTDTRAFCAGGDVKEVREMVLKSKSDPSYNNKVRDFFFLEYLICFLNYTYEKPVIVVADGITFGAGLGLLRSGHIRIVTENTKLAMPEMAIGFFPDVGASFFLHKIPDGLGVYLGLTGIHFNSADALSWGLGTHYVESQKKSGLLTDLAKISWPKTNGERKQEIIKAVNKFVSTPRVGPEVAPYLDSIKEIMKAGTLRDFSENLKVHAPLPHMEFIFNASPISVAVTFNLLKMSGKWSVAESLMNEWVMAVKFCRDSDFCEGVRALLVDKDKQPKWHFPEILKVPEELIAGYFNFQLLKYDNPWDEYVGNRILPLS